MTTTHSTTRRRQAPHDTSPNSFIGRLNLEWEALRRSASANATAAAWADSDPALAGLGTLKLIEQAVAGRKVDERIDGIFYALARRASCNDPDAGLAARILTQLMLPKAILIARTCARELDDRDEQIQLAVCSLYEVIRTFPARTRTDHVPSHLAWSAVHAVRRSVLAQTYELPDDSLDALPAPPAEPNPNEKIGRLLGWAVDEHVITAAEAQLLMARYGTEDASRPTWKTIGNLATVAAEEGISLVTARQRCSRAVRRIAAAVSAYPEPLVSPRR